MFKTKKTIDVKLLNEEIEKISKITKKIEKSEKKIDEQVIIIKKNISEINTKKELDKFKDNLTSDLDLIKKDLSQSIINLKIDLNSKFNSFTQELKDKINQEYQLMKNDIKVEKESINELIKLFNKLNANTNLYQEELSKLIKISKNIKAEDFELSNFAKKIIEYDKEKISLIKENEKLKTIIGRNRRSRS